MESTWTITELAETAALALADEPVRVNGRVREQPNERLIRWYTTIGLVDPPLARRGRTSLYGRRHLLQLVAVKRRQAAGRTIAEIQAELTGATDETLRRIAGISEPSQVAERLPGDPGEPGEPGDPGEPHQGRERFWASATPARAGRTPPAAAGTGDRIPQPAAYPDRPRDTNRPPATEGFPVAVRLAPGVTIVLDRAPDDWPPAPERLDAIRATAGPLLAELYSNAPQDRSAPATPPAVATPGSAPDPTPGHPAPEGGTAPDAPPHQP